MNYKLKSVKLWLMIALIVFVGFLNYSGTVDGTQYIDFIKWLFGIFVAGNVGAKITNKVEV
ncbi:MAG: hypothetical protein KAR42_11215 [candidate division Zixibacteria bacterium]|nr:hypothetical protein [candidate division Zixibacteria bacterium]